MTEPPDASRTSRADDLDQRVRDTYDPDEPRSVAASLAAHLPGPAAEFWRRDCENTDPHGPHQVDHRDHSVEATCDNQAHAVCRGDHRVWCYGVVDPDTLRGELEALRPGQRVRVVFEGVVDEPRFGFYRGDTEWPALSVRQEPDNPRSDMVVLRYTGGHPGTTDEGYKIRGPIHEALVAVEVILDDE